MEDVVIDPMNLSPRGDDDQDRPSTGFINHLLCNLVSGGGRGGGREEEEEKEDDEKKRSINVSEVEDEDKAKGGGGGLISHLISNLVSPISPKVGKVEAFDGNGGLLKQGKTEDEGGGGGGVIENLVSRLPSPLQDDVAPTTDEASILIHSIIHD
ncbi:uncharacterized protein LOC132190497 isoform X1 [Corylus avellana]|uniref:uncharacterized protein LOC132190497 isoform X1 n=1 Tax=Corylus avellana TaxID=13451 RepID=UPI001E22D32F|nr:uncharacterized protein LOC132190497 isoform X1 [Corylus avellana]